MPIRRIIALVLWEGNRELREAARVRCLTLGRAAITFPAWPYCPRLTL
jgi:hypothetical protein